ncbi:transmembrane protein 132E-like protein [Lates japonicus]|uniref:Transmembrane protein 132E-like protein n=1 Tax=Lates japonicus TaxID=270547 RepID=A0AAD3QVG1_LATJO|nr:transmembrane protein 132E-like protein [Lates japonicus]
MVESPLAVDAVLGESAFSVTDLQGFHHRAAGSHFISRSGPCLTQPSPATANTMVATTWPPGDTTAPKQEASLSIWMLFSDNTAATLTHFDPKDYKPQCPHWMIKLCRYPRSLSSAGPWWWQHEDLGEMVESPETLEGVQTSCHGDHHSGSSQISCSKPGTRTWVTAVSGFTKENGEDASSPTSKRKRAGLTTFTTLPQELPHNSIPIADEETFSGFTDMAFKTRRNCMKRE